MAYETKDNTGALFINDKQGNAARPDRTGRAMISGTLYRVSGWLKKDKSGNPYLSLSFQEHDAPKRESAPPDDPSEEIPF